MTTSRTYIDGDPTRTRAGSTATPTPNPPPPPDPFAPVPGAVGPSSQIAGGRQLWSIDGRNYLVWQVPVDADGDGEFDETFPIAFLAYPEELRRAGISGRPTVTLSAAEWESIGGLEMGTILDLDNPDRDPFKYFVDEMTRQAEIYPHLLDPEIMAVTAGAWLMGRAATEDDFKRTQWWQEHPPEAREFLLLDPAEQARRIRDNRILVLDMLQQSGVNNAPDDLVNLMADSFTRGEWTDVYLANQVAVVADPAKRGVLDTAVSDFLSGQTVTLDTTASRRDRVRAAALEWLGPVFGAWTDAQVEDWAGRLRNDPDAEAALTEMLAGQRMAMFSNYTNPSLTYTDIASPWKQMVNQLWGEIPDETDPFFIDLVKLNDGAKAQKLLLKEGLARGVRQVSEQALRDLDDSMRGQTRIVRAQ